MSPERIFTKKLMGLDYRVWRVMLVTCLLSLGLLSYRLLETKDCRPVNIIIKTIGFNADSSYDAGESISFIASANQDEVVWDFGDNSAKVPGQYVAHTYRTPGSYKVTATTGITCIAMKTINIVAVPEVDNNQPTGEEIIGPVSTIIGKEEIFTTMATAKVYEWSISNYKLTQAGSTARFKFPSAGRYTVQLTLDGDRTKRYTKDVNVEASTQPTISTPEPVKKLLPDEEGAKIPELEPLKSVVISDATFLEYLLKVNKKQMTAAEFNKYLCYKGETKAVLNGDLMTFAELCDDLSGKKRKRFIIGKTKIKIDLATMKRDNDGCVNIIEVKYH